MRTERLPGHGFFFFDILNSMVWVSPRYSIINFNHTAWDSVEPNAMSLPFKIVNIPSTHSESSREVHQATNNYDLVRLFNMVYWNILNLDYYKDHKPNFK